MRYPVRPERLDEAARVMARVAARGDGRLLAIKRLAEEQARHPGPSPQGAGVAR